MNSKIELLTSKLMFIKSAVIVFTIFISSCTQQPDVSQFSSPTSSPTVDKSPTQAPSPSSSPTASYAFTETPTATLTVTPEGRNCDLDFQILTVQVELEKMNIDFDLSPGEETEYSIAGQYIRSDQVDEFAVFVNLFGQEPMLEQATMLVLIPPETDQQNHKEIFNFMEAMLSSTIPGWSEGKSWLESSLEGIHADRLIEMVQDDFSVGLERMVYEVPTINAISYILFIQTTSADQRLIINTTPEPTPTAQPGWANYSDSDISFAIPVDWKKIDTSYDPKCQTVACLLEIQKPSEKALLFFIRSVTESSGVTSFELDEILWNARVEMISESGLGEELVLEELNEITVDGRAALERVFTEPNFLETPRNESAYVINIVFSHGPYSYILALSADTIESRDINRQIIDQIVESIRLTYLLLE